MTGEAGARKVDGWREGGGRVSRGGLTGRAVGRRADWLRGLTSAEVRPLLRQALAHRFGLVWEEEAR